MTHLLDTNACVEFLRQGFNSKIAAKLVSAAPGSIMLCTVVVAELAYGACRSQQPAQAIQQVDAFCKSYTSIPFDDKAARQFAQIRAHLDKMGTPIGPYDLLIAAIALANGLVLVTHNTAEFSRVPGSMFEDWQTP